MASRLSSPLVLPTCLTICFGLWLVASAPSTGGDAGQARTVPQEDLKQSLDDEVERVHAEWRASVRRVEALEEQFRVESEKMGAERRVRTGGTKMMDERLRAANADLEKARAERRRANEENARIQAEIEALREALRKAGAGR